MEGALTGESAALFLGAMFDSANRGTRLDVKAVARDAVAARSSRKALTRLRLANQRLRSAPVVRAAARPRCARPRGVSRGIAARRCKAAGGEDRPPRGSR